MEDRSTWVSSMTSCRMAATMVEVYLRKQPGFVRVCCLLGCLKWASTLALHSPAPVFLCFRHGLGVCLCAEKIHVLSLLNVFGQSRHAMNFAHLSYCTVGGMLCSTISAVSMQWLT